MRSCDALLVTKIDSGCVSLVSVVSPPNSFLNLAIVMTSSMVVGIVAIPFSMSLIHLPYLCLSRPNRKLMVSASSSGYTSGIVLVPSAARLSAILLLASWKSIMSSLFPWLICSNFSFSLLTVNIFCVVPVPSLSTNNFFVIIFQVINGSAFADNMLSWNSLSLFNFKSVGLSNSLINSE